MERLKKWIDISYKMGIFLGQKLCIPRTSLREFLVLELLVDGLVGHLGNVKPLKRLSVSFISIVSSVMLTSMFECVTLVNMPSNKSRIPVSKLHFRYQIVLGRMLAGISC